MATDCGCGPDWQTPKSNGTCGTCGGWLPGEGPSTEFFASLLYGRPLVRSEVQGGALDGLPIFHEPPASPRKES